MSGPPRREHRTTRRDPRLDFFRGLALLAIGLNHCYPPADAGFPHYQIGHFFSFNFADVFVFISGIVCGAVYLQVFERDGFSACLRKACRRCLSIIVANGVAAAICILLVVAFAAIAGVSAPHHHLRGHDALTAWLGSAFLYDPIPYFNILNLYVLLLFLLPFMLAGYLRIGRWTLLLAALPWAAINFLPPEAFGSFAWLTAPAPFFGAPAGWQFLFFLSVALGIEGSRGTLPRFPVGWGTLLALALLVGADYLAQVRPLLPFSGKHTAGPARIAEILVVAYLLSQALRPGSAFFELFWVRRVVECGKNALVVFCVSLVSAYLASLTASALGVGQLGYAVLLVVATGLNLLSANLRVPWLDARRAPDTTPSVAFEPIPAQPTSARGNY